MNIPSGLVLIIWYSKLTSLAYIGFGQKWYNTNKIPPPLLLCGSHSHYSGTAHPGYSRLGTSREYF